jgi:hypothetical protein
MSEKSFISETSVVPEECDETEAGSERIHRKSLLARSFKVRPKKSQTRYQGDQRSMF